MQVHTHCKKLFGQFETLSTSEMSFRPILGGARFGHAWDQRHAHPHHTTPNYTSAFAEEWQSSSMLVSRCYMQRCTSEKGDKGIGKI